MENMETLIGQIKTDMTSGKTDEEIFQYLLPWLEKDPQTGGRLAELLVTIPDRLSGKLLHRMFEATQDKKVRKMIKRSLYRLKSKGVVVEEVLSEKERSILRPMPEEAKEKNPFPVVEIEPSYVARLFGQAYQLNLEKKGTSPQSYLQAKSEIERIKKDYAKPLIYSYFQAEDIAGDDRFLRKGAELFKADVFSSWRIEEEQIGPYADEVREAEESKIVLNPGQKEVRFQAIFEKALAELFSGEKRHLYQRRLEEMAYVLFKLGREEEAKISLAVAMDLEKPLHPIQPSPFLLQLVTKSIFSLLAEAKEKKAKEVSLIVKP
jgi:hypothetical protein